MRDSKEIAAKLEDYMDSGYFDGAIRKVYLLLNHIHFLEQQVAVLKATIARMQSDTWEREGSAARGSRSVCRPEGDLDTVPVPVDDLKALSSEFRGAALSERRLAALLRVTSSLKPPSPSPEDQHPSIDYL